MQHRTVILPRRRTGLTLYEVVLAFAIFMLAMAAISQVLTVGTRAALNSQLQSQAALLAESKMAEVVAGAQPMTPTANELFSEDDPSWMWDMEVTDASRVSAAGLKEVTLTVRHSSNAGENAVYTIRRYVRDPMIFVDAANQAADKAAEEAANSSSSSGMTGGM